jgi:hypothetical protein
MGVGGAAQAAAAMMATTTRVVTIIKNILAVRTGVYMYEDTSAQRRGLYPTLVRRLQLVLENTAAAG